MIYLGVSKKFVGLFQIQWNNHSLKTDELDFCGILKSVWNDEDFLFLYL